MRLKRKGIVITPADLPGANWPERMCELNLNLLGIHSGGGAVHDVLEVLGDTIGEPFRRSVADLNLELEYEVHAAGSLMPRERFAAHPDWFVQNWKYLDRRPEGNWCLHSPGARQEIVDNAKRLAKAMKPSTGRIFFWGADVMYSYCHCADCCRYTPAEQNLMTANLFAEALREVIPNVKVACLIYAGEAFEVPRKVRPAPGVFLEFAPMNHCYVHALNDPNCAVNRNYWRVLNECLEVFDPAEAHVLEYWLDSSYYCFERHHPRAKVIFNPEHVERDVELYCSLGITSMTTFAVNMDSDYFETWGDKDLRSYAQLLNRV